MSLRLAGIILVTAACKKEEAPPPPPAFDAAAMIAAATAPTPGAMEKGAREQFATKFSCPDERVTAKRRTDLDPATAKLAELAAKTPPSEVQNDPGRLEKWKADQEKERELVVRSSAEHEVFEVTGCDHTLVLDCRPHHANGAVYPNWADCNEQKGKR